MCSNHEKQLENSAQRLTIAHLLLWMTCVGVLAAISAHENQVIDVPARWQPVLQLFQLLDVLLIGAATTGGIVVASQVAFGERSIYSFLPGYWLTLQICFGSLIEVLYLLIEYCWSAIEASENLSPLGNWWSILVPLCQICLSLCAIFSYRFRGIWFYFFLAQLCYLLCILAWSLLGFPDASTSYYVTNIPSYLSIPVIALLVLATYRLQISGSRCTDWIHWAGIIVFLLLSLSSLFWNTIGWRFVIL